MFSLGEVIVELLGAAFRRMGGPGRLTFATSDPEAALNHVFYKLCTNDTDSSDVFDEIRSTLKDRIMLDTAKLQLVITQCQMAKNTITGHLLNKFVSIGTLKSSVTLRDIRREVNSIADSKYSWLSAKNRLLVSDHCKDLMTSSSIPFLKHWGL